MKCARVDVERREAMKTRVDAVGRKTVAERLGTSYNSLSHRLGGFYPLTEDYARKIEAVLDEQV